MLVKNNCPKILLTLVKKSFYQLQIIKQNNHIMFFDLTARVVVNITLKFLQLLGWSVALPKNRFTNYRIGWPTALPIRPFLLGGHQYYPNCYNCYSVSGGHQYYPKQLIFHIQVVIGITQKYHHKMQQGGR